MKKSELNTIAKQIRADFGSDAKVFVFDANEGIQVVFNIGKLCLSKHIQFLLDIKNVQGFKELVTTVEHQQPAYELLV